MSPKIKVLAGWNETSLLEEIWAAWQLDQSVVVVNPEYLKISSASENLKDLVSDEHPFAKTMPSGFHLILLTSGSTGQPKWCALDRTSVLFNVETIHAHLRLTSEHRILSTMPLFHSFGAVLCGLHSKIKSMPYEFVDRTQLASALAQSSSPVFIPLVPRMIEQISFQPQLKGVSVTGGDIVSAAHIERLRRDLPGVQHTIGYGLTEAGPILCHTSLEGHNFLPEYLGHALKGIELKIDSSNQLWFRSPGKMSHTFNSDQKQWCKSGDDWLQTGDLVQKTSSGLQYLGRTKWIIKKRGESVSPLLIENNLRIQVGQDLDCLVFPVQLEFTDEIGIAFNNSARAKGEARLHAAIRNLPSFFRPQHIIWLDAWPLTSSGKIDRRAVVENYGKVRSV
ncbi:MAG: acyl--CoA ligase [Bdellovibrio sp.]|nr:acyl--CoA ligase [Bdellovibrio sp.]